MSWQRPDGRQPNQLRPVNLNSILLAFLRVLF
ncbi:hypothetical protein CWATWH0003_3742 [Crocosphaera watsonii WH 0003]|uniref:Uncharacterized protein n=1 Tax=Crocosphaera watsonii WH 0003 TaxID=423471 RepID=G5J8G2_CROWT|nr:hypothetical protein CWATWH0003_3742 [Crocosphaera watsonii WH 0003]